MLNLDEFGGVAHSHGCAYCRGRWSYRGDPWEWFVSVSRSDNAARFVFAHDVFRHAEKTSIPVHPVATNGRFLAHANAPHLYQYAALPMYAEEALRHVQYEEGPLVRLFGALEDPTVRSASGAAFKLGGSFALRDYLRGAGAL
jgi:hypothetical protein